MRVQNRMANRVLGRLAMRVVTKLPACLFLYLLSLNSAHAEFSGSLRPVEPYSIEGLGVGMEVAPNSWQYKRYHCRASEQYASSIVCRFAEKKGGVSKAITILHLVNNVVTYINKSVSPAFFSQQDIQSEWGLSH